MLRIFASGINAVMTAGTTGITNGAMVHGSGGSKTARGMADITGSCRGNMGRRLTDSQHPIVTGLALCRQYFKHTTDMAGFTIDQIMIARQRKTGNQVVKG